MRHSSNGTSTSLQQDLVNSIRTYLDGFLATQEENIPLNRVRLLEYVQSRDKSLARRKRALLEKAIDSVCHEHDPQTIDMTHLDNSTRGLQDIHLVTGEEIVENSINGAASKRKATDRSGNDTKRKRSDLARNPPTDLSLADLGGIEDCLTEACPYLGLNRPLNESNSSGVLLHGPPGCGKTLLANAIAGEVGVSFISVSAPSLVSGMSGETEKKIRELFDEARRLAPCLVFLDEVDAITPKRESAQREMERRIVAQILTCMDELSIEKTEGKPVLVIGATNRPDSLDPALRRAGRFDREISMGVPDEKSRELILQVLCRKLKLSGEIHFGALARATPGFVGADLNALTAAAGVAAIKRIFQRMQHQVTSSLDSPMVGIDESSTITRYSDNLMDSSTIRQFLHTHSGTLTEADMQGLSIEHEDFVSALPSIQPSSKREGFTTVPDVSWADIGALEAVRVELQMAIVQPIRRPALYRSVGITAPAGVLLWGPPGCGKTLLAKAVARESQANFISIRGPELLNKYVGESERAVRQVFARARASAPCVIFFDELDALVPRRDDSLSESSSRVVNTLLTELDGLEDRKGVYVVAATNRPDMIDPAMLRPGRLDKPLFVQLPTASERFDILQTLSKALPLVKGIDLRTLADDTSTRNFSGADLAALVRESAVSALRKTVLQDSYSEALDVVETSGPSIQIELDDFRVALERVKPSVSEGQRAKYERLFSRYNI